MSKKKLTATWPRHDNTPTLWIIIPPSPTLMPLHISYSHFLSHQNCWDIHWRSGEVKIRQFNLLVQKGMKSPYRIDTLILYTMHCLLQPSWSRLIISCYLTLWIYNILFYLKCFCFVFLFPVFILTYIPVWNICNLYLWPVPPIPLPQKPPTGT